MLEFTNEIINKRKNRIEVYTCFLEFLIHYLYWYLYLFIKKREDFIQYLIDHEETEDSKIKQNARTISNEGIISLSMLFFTAGYRNIAMTLSYITYNLAVYSVYQDELLNEITNVLERHVNKTLLK